MMLMRLNAIIFQLGNNNSFTGFLESNPSVCAQGNSVDEVQNKLVKFSKLYFDYMSKTEYEVEPCLVDEL